MLYDTQADAGQHGEPRGPHGDSGRLEAGAGAKLPLLLHPDGKDPVLCPPHEGRLCAAYFRQPGHSVAAGAGNAAACADGAGRGAAPFRLAGRAAVQEDRGTAQSVWTWSTRWTTTCYEEISPLLNRINRQHEEIQQQLRVMRQRTDEFNQIIGNMQEGLVLLDEKETVLSINTAAMKLFGVDENCVGQRLPDGGSEPRDQSGHSAVPFRRPRGNSLSSGRPSVPVRSEPYRLRRPGRGRGAAGLRYYRAGIRRAQPPGVHRQRVPRAENARCRAFWAAPS